MAEAAYDALVVGGGVHGLAAAWHLLRLEAGRVAVLEQFRIGHAHGSSHGASRITRSTYGDAAYVRLMGVANAEEWPRLERDAERTLVHRVPGCFFGPAGGTIEAHAEAVRTAAAPVERLDPADARRRFPQFRFDACESVLVDGTAGLIAAEAVVESLSRLVRDGGADVREATHVLEIRGADDAVEVRTERGMLRAAHVVVTAGAWIGRLVPSLAPRLSVTRQTVGYFAPGGAPEDFRLPRFPVWVYLGPAEDEHWYGLPEYGRPGIKAARHATAGADDDPDDAAPAADPAEVDALRAFLDRELAAPVGACIATERCLYTTTPTHDFVLDVDPRDSRIVIGSPCSGHGFKFAPLVGRVLAELALRGRTTVPEFESERARFAARCELR